MEIWKDIKGYENKYQVSNKGNIRNIKTDKQLKLQVYKKVVYLMPYIVKTMLYMDIIGILYK